MLPYKVALVGAALTALPSRGFAENVRPGIGDWTWPPFIVISLLLVGVLYGLGAARMSRAGSKSALGRRSIWFALGWVSLVIALDSPLHEIGEQLFWVHMTQHEILMLISAPLLTLGRPLVPFLWALPPRWREPVVAVSQVKLFKTTWKTIAAPLSAWLLSACALWIWHVPLLFNQTLRSDWIHAAQHSTFLLSGLLFWWPLAGRRPTIGYGGALAYVFTTALHTSVLGALLTFAPRPWYPPYVATAPAWHITALEDQQLGGLIMWVPAGAILLIIALVLLVKWMSESQNRWQYTRMAELSRSAGGAIR